MKIYWDWDNIYCTRLTKETLYSLHNQGHLLPTQDFFYKESRKQPKPLATRHDTCLRLFVWTNGCGIWNQDIWTKSIFGPMVGPIQCLVQTSMVQTLMFQISMLRTLYCSQCPVVQTYDWFKDPFGPKIFGSHYGNDQSKVGPKLNCPKGTGPKRIWSK